MGNHVNHISCAGVGNGGGSGNKLAESHSRTWIALADDGNDTGACADPAPVAPQLGVINQTINERQKLDK